MDDVTKCITDTQNQIIKVLNESGLHPMVLSLILNQIQNQLQAAINSQPANVNSTEQTNTTEG